MVGGWWVVVGGGWWERKKDTSKTGFAEKRFSACFRFMKSRLGSGSILFGKVRLGSIASEPGVGSARLGSIPSGEIPARLLLIAGATFINDN